MTDGVLVVDKTAGVTSHDIVDLVRRRKIARTVGHAGTLDPFATGVLPVLLGVATRLSRFLISSTKTYSATVRFGTETDTGDLSGTPIAEGPVPGESAVRVALARLTGKIAQVPPAWSAKWVDGERAHAAARAGRPLTLEPVEVDVSEFALVAWRPPEAEVRVSCSAGTYIRALARDLGRALGSAAHLTALRRTRAGQFALDQAVPVVEVDTGNVEMLATRVVPIEALSLDLPAVTVSSRGETALRHGRLVCAAEVGGLAATVGAEWVRVLAEDGRLLALGAAATRFGRPDELHASLVLTRDSRSDSRAGAEGGARIA